MFSKILLICVLSCFAYSHAGVAPFIVPCKAEDSACIVTSANKAIPHLAAGIPELGVPSADPLLLDDVVGDSGELKLRFKNMKVTGSKNCKITEASRNTAESLLSLVIQCPIVATGQYVMGGKLLVTAAEGEGDFEIKTDNIQIMAEAKLETVTGADGVKHWHIASHTPHYLPIKPFTFKFDNLFNGDETKAKQIIDIVNLSWKEVILDIGKPIIHEIINKAVVIIEKFVQAVPLNELEL